MRPVLSRKQIRDFDAIHIARGVPGIVLMENAGRGAAHIIGLKAKPRNRGEAPRQGSTLAGSCVRCADEKSLSGTALVLLCGVGNNGGDGYVVARHLVGRGASIRVIGLCKRESLSGDARIAANALVAVGVSIDELPPKEEWAGIFDGADLIVDALLGTGADRTITGRLAELIVALNESSTQVVSLDMPSGLDADTGAKLGVVVQAAHTVTFSHLKRGLLTTEGHLSSGTITVSNIGVPARLPSSVEPVAWLMEESDLCAKIPPRRPSAHKSEAGRVVIVAGSPGTLGAARLVGHACLRTGAGMVTLSSDPEAADKLDSEVTELMTHRWGDNDAETFSRADALVVGPGLGSSSEAVAGIQRALEAKRPTVLDADGLRWLAREENKGFVLSKRNSALMVLTPHPGEAADLLQSDVASVESDRFAAVTALAERFGAVVVLKGSRTLIAAPGLAPVVCAFGSPALATAGSGDVLAGILGALLIGVTGQEEVFERAQLSVAVHALSAELWSAKNGERGLLASEVADEIPRLLESLRDKKN